MKRNEYRPYLAAGVTAFLVIACAIFLFFLIYHGGIVKSFFVTLTYILRPIFYGLVLAFLLLPVHRWILRALTAMTSDARLADQRNRSFLNFVAILSSIILAAFVIYILLAMVIPQVYFSIVGLVKAFPGYIESLQGLLMKFLERNPEIQAAVLPYYESAALSLQNWLQSELVPNFESVQSTLAWLRQEILPNVSGMVSGVSSLLIGILMLMKDMLIAVIVSVYLLARKDTFAAQTKKITYSLFRTNHADFLVEETRNAYRILSGFINGKLVDSLIIGVITLVCCNLFKFPYPMLIATIIGVTNIIPFFGPFIGAIPCALLILMVSPLQCIYFLIFILLLQQFDGNILGPKILGDSTGLASFWVLFSILLFGGLFGFIGMVMGVPVFAMIYSIVNRLVRYGLNKRGLPVETVSYVGQTSPFSKIEEKEEAS